MVKIPEGKLPVQGINTKARDIKRRVNHHPKALLNTKLQGPNPPPVNQALVHAQIKAGQRQKPDTSFPPQNL
jgi:hypothetical protein